MEAIYLNKFASTWQGVNIAAAKIEWAERLGAFRNSELKRGLDLLTTRDWPPNLSEFIAMCRPPVEYESAYREACRNLALRDLGNDVWSDPSVYWAALKFGQYDIARLTYPQAAKRWQTILDKVIADGCPPVPPRLLALPPVGKSTKSKEEAAEIMANLRKTVFNMTKGE